VAVEYGLLPPGKGELNGGRPAEDGDTEPWGLVGDWNPDWDGNLGGEPPHLSMCSGFTLVWIGLEGGSWAELVGVACR